MELLTLGITAATAIVIPLGTSAAKKIYSNEKRLTVLETNYANVDKKLDGVDEKLQRLIERFL